MQTQTRILVVDDDPDIRSLLKRFLDQQGFRTSIAADEREMKEALATEAVDLIVLDVLLPGSSGLDICRRLRAEGQGPAIILLTALKEEVDRIIGLEIGADDYLGKPFSARELVARIKAVLRRGQPASGTIDDVCYNFEGFVAEPATRRVLGPDGEDLVLTGAEFNLLQVFLDRPGRVLSRDQLLDITKGRTSDVFDRSIDVLVSRLRRKFGDKGAALFKAVRNGGYQLAARVDKGAGYKS